MLSCRELTELVGDYVDGDLDPGARLRFELHIDGCEPCRQYVEQVRLVRDSMPILPPPPMPAEVEVEMRERFRLWRATPGPLSADPKKNPPSA